MFRNYFAVAIRNIRRNKLFSVIHVLGLAIGLSASLVIFLIVKFESGFDTFQPDDDRIYRIVMDMTFSGVEGHSSAVPAPLAPAIMEEVTGVQATAPVMQFQRDSKIDVTIPANGPAPRIFKKQAGAVFTTPGYFDIMPYVWLEGSPEKSLTTPFSVVLTESRAKTYFPGKHLNDIVGSDMIFGEDLQTRVTGIVRDLNEQSDMDAMEFISYATIDKTSFKHDFMMTVWDDGMAYSKAYVKLSEANDQAGVTSQLNGLLAKYNKNINKPGGNTAAFVLQPLRDIHFNLSYAGHDRRTANKNVLYGLSSIALFLLILACINFINLSTAQATRRAKEIGIRKSVGGIRSQLTLQFLCESLCVTTMAMVISIAITQPLLGILADFLPEGLNIDLLQQPSGIAFVIVLGILVTLLAGSYPALHLSRMRPSLVLKNMASNGGSPRSLSLRKALTVSQFTIAQVFIIGAIMVTKQIRFAMTEELGYRTRAIGYFEMPRDTINDHRAYLLREISTLPGVQMTSAGFLAPAMEGAAFTNVSYKKESEVVDGVPVQIRWGDERFLPLYEVDVVAGRNINAGSPDTEVLINEAYAKTLGFQHVEDAIGESLDTPHGTHYSIVGIMRDFHQGSFHQEIGPLLFRASQTGGFIHVAMTPGQPWAETIEKIQSAFHVIYPNADFNFEFFDQTIAKFYKQEQQTSALLNWAMGLSVLISCLGLLGLVVYTAENRRKEIGIRKVLGATVSSIVSTLSSEFVKLVFIAFVIATPIAWYAVTKWLDGFAYKTSISWWVIAASGLLLLAVSILTLSFQTLSAARRNPVDSLRTE